MQLVQEQGTQNSKCIAGHFEGQESTSVHHCIACGVRNHCTVV